MKKIISYLLAVAAMVSLAGCDNEKKEFVEFQVQTVEITEITETSAKTGGKTTCEKNVTITERGVCWSISQNPTTESDKTRDGEGLGEFTSEISGLEPGTTYYVRAYAVSGTIVRYGEELSFTTEKTVPVVETTEITEITDVSAKFAGLINVAATDITEVGFCWGTTENPGADGPKVAGTYEGSGFYANIVALQPETAYFVRAYAVMGDETHYGEQLSFTTLELAGYASGISNITANIDMPEMTGDGMVECWEDYFAEDTYYWSMILYSVGRMGMPDDEIQLEFNTPINDMNTIPDGRYPIARNIQEGVVNTADPGNRDENGDDRGCWYYFHDGENYTSEAAAVGGKGFVEIERVEGSGEEAFYNISFEFYDTNGYKITGKMEEGYILNFSATAASSTPAMSAQSPKTARAKAKFDAKRSGM